MTLSKAFYLAMILVLIAFTGVALALTWPHQAKGELSSAACTASSTRWAIGHQEAKTLLPSRQNRAFGMIEQPINATNTASITTNGSAAVAGQGHQLTPATTTSPVPSIIFGKNTDYPTTGSISAITNVGSTSIIVTECLY